MTLATHNVVIWRAVRDAGPLGLWLDAVHDIVVGMTRQQTVWALKSLVLYGYLVAAGPRGARRWYVGSQVPPGESSTPGAAPVKVQPAAHCIDHALDTRAAVMRRRGVPNSVWQLAEIVAESVPCP